MEQQPQLSQERQNLRPTALEEELTRVYQIVNQLQHYNTDFSR